MVLWTDYAGPFIHLPHLVYTQKRMAQYDQEESFAASDEEKEEDEEEKTEEEEDPQVD